VWVSAHGFTSPFLLLPFVASLRRWGPHGFSARPSAYNQCVSAPSTAAACFPQPSKGARPPHLLIRPPRFTVGRHATAHSNGEGLIGRPAWGACASGVSAFCLQPINRLQSRTPPADPPTPSPDLARQPCACPSTAVGRSSRADRLHAGRLLNSPTTVPPALRLAARSLPRSQVRVDTHDVCGAASSAPFG